MLLASCAAYVEQRVESVIVEALPRVVGPADRYEATVRGANAAATHFDQVSAVGARVQRPRAPVLDRVEMDLFDVSVDRAAKRVTSVGDARANVKLRAEDLAAYLGRQSWIEAPTVRFDSSAEVIVSGRLKLPGLALMSNSIAEFRGRLIPHDSQLLLEVASLRLGDREAPALALGVVEQAINPIFNAADHAVPSRIDAVVVDGASLVIAASGSQMTLRDGRTAEDRRFR